MKTLKIALALAAITITATLAIGLSLAHYTDTPFDYTQGYLPETENEDWWTEMREHMEARWTGIEDEEWFYDMTQYMEEHWNEVQNQAWFNQMLEYMEEHGYHPNYRNYGDYYGPRGYGRCGFGCWGW